MSKTQKELAFLRDLNVDADWTARFTETFDKKFEFSNEENILYVNSGTGDHPLALGETLGEDIEIRAVSENRDLNRIAAAKAAAVKARVEFSTDYPAEKFDTVIGNASFVRPGELRGFLKQIIDLSDYKVAFFLPTAGSFGEIFSVLWEVLSESRELAGQGGAVENLISELPQVSEIEEIAETAGLGDLRTNTEIEIFEYEDGREFVDSTLIGDFLLPVWLDFLSEEQKEKVRERLVRAIDASRDNMSFRFSVKATLFTGKKQ